MGLLAALLASDTATLPEALPQGAQASRLAAGVWQVAPAVATMARPVVLSAAIHGDETAPLERLAAALDAIVTGRLVARTPLLFVFGNLAALRAGKRFLDEDMNRLFGGRHGGRTSREAPRAAELEAALACFCTQHPAPLHLDLHSAIRASRHACFAVHPCAAAAPPDAAQRALLEASGIEALLLARGGGPTFSAHSAQAHGGESYTFEIGRVRSLGAGAAAEWVALDAVLASLIEGAALPAPATTTRVFRIERELIKHSDAFRLFLPADAPNFTALAAGSLLAEDGDLRWFANEGEHIVFPNPGVRPGLRAGLLAVPLDS